MGFEWLTLLNRCGNGSRTSAKRRAVGYWIAGNRRVRHLREYPELKKTRLIIMTGVTTRSDRQQSLEAGFEHHLAEPVAIRKYFRNSWRHLPSNSRHGRGKKTETRGCKVPSDS
ncbi:MAG: hypothetical protein DMF22_09325 [Verrucomicrobia bacterium]|nr:MAG: hypothetical protein DMF22_09325 [Verrucomicrobiota bacterium]